MDIIKWCINFCNVNSGFIMALLTLIYVIATIYIYKANVSSVKVSQKQIKEEINIQEQNLRLSLFEKRYSIIKILTKWMLIIEHAKVYSDSVKEDVNREEAFVNHFSVGVLSDSDYPEILELNKEMQELNGKRNIERKVDDINMRKKFVGIRIITDESMFLNSARYIFDGLEFKDFDMFLIGYSKIGMVAFDFTTKTEKENISKYIDETYDACKKLREKNFLDGMQKQLNIYMESLRKN